SQVLMNDFADQTKLMEDLGEIDKAAKRCQNIISDLLEFSRQDDVHAVSGISLNDVVLKTIPLLKTALRFHSLQTDLTEKSISVRIKPHLLQQVVFNLIHNACQAMKEPGTVTIQ